MSQIAERVAGAHAETLHDMVTLCYDAAHEAWAHQDAVVQAMRDTADRGPGDEVDHAMTYAQLDEQAALANTLRNQLDDLAAAVARCADGTYGSCESCHEPIPIERLALFPAATHCVPCKQQFKHR